MAEVAENPIEVELLRRCRGGEALAWKELYEGHFPFVYRVARRLGTPAEEIEDVCQESFVVAFRKLSSFERGSLRAWLYRIVANTVSARHRKRRVRSAFAALFGNSREEAIVTRTAERELEAREAEAAVSRVLGRLKPKKREVLVLYEFEGLSGEEIAAHLGCPVDTVWSRLHHARADFEKLARKMGVAT